MPRLTIVIVTYNSVRHIGACLTSLTANPPVVEHDTIDVLVFILRRIQQVIDGIVVGNEQDLSVDDLR